MRRFSQAPFPFLPSPLTRKYRTDASGVEPPGPGKPPNPPNFPRYDYHKLQLSVVHDLNRAWSVQLGGFLTVAGTKIHATAERDPAAVQQMAEHVDEAAEGLGALPHARVGDPDRRHLLRDRRHVAGAQARRGTGGRAGAAALPGPKDQQVVAELRHVGLHLLGRSLADGEHRNHRGHPDDDAMTNLPVEIQFSNYQATQGVQTPSKVLEFIQGTQALTLTVNSVAVNSSVTPAISNRQVGR